MISIENCGTLTFIALSSSPHSLSDQIFFESKICQHNVRYLSETNLYLIQQSSSRVPECWESKNRITFSNYVISLWFTKLSVQSVKYTMASLKFNRSKFLCVWVYLLLLTLRQQQFEQTIQHFWQHTKRREWGREFEWISGVDKATECSCMLEILSCGCKCTSVCRWYAKNGNCCAELHKSNNNQTCIIYAVYDNAMQCNGQTIA